jgi:glycosyltransferase involved in cell wall biosynthesis
MYSACIWAKKHKVPLVFDPLISAYDKQVYERKKFAPEDSKAITLLNWEKNIFQKATMVIGDTREHCTYFHTTFGVEQSRLIDIAVGAEEKFFKPATHPSDMRNTITVLFYGSFLGLQGPLTIIEAAKQYNGPEVQWKLIGEGPLLGKCKTEAAGLDSVEFIPWVPYEDLPSHIQKADIVLGIFGTSEKANRVIPNKVYQTLACGKPLVTMRSPAYPKGFTTDHDLGIYWVTAGDADDLATAVAELAGKKAQLQDQGDKAYSTFIKHFSEAGIEQRLLTVLKQFCS